jgi:hypothetical protein
MVWQTTNVTGMHAATAGGVEPVIPTARDANGTALPGIQMNAQPAGSKVSNELVSGSQSMGC